MTQQKHTGGIGRDPQRKRIPRVMTKKRTNTEPNPYMKLMNKLGGGKGVR